MGVHQHHSGELHIHIGHLTTNPLKPTTRKARSLASKARIEKRVHAHALRHSGASEIGAFFIIIIVFEESPLSLFARARFRHCIGIAKLDGFPINPLGQDEHGLKRMYRLLS